MRNYWWFTAALLDVGGAAFYLPKIQKDERLPQFRRNALELFVEWLPEIEAASPLFQSAGRRGAEMRKVWPTAILRLAQECGYDVVDRQSETNEKRVQVILEDNSVIDLLEGRPRLRKLDP